MYLRALEICVLKDMSLILQNFFSAPGLAWEVALEKMKAKLDLLIDIDMLLMVEKRKRRGQCHFIYRYAKPNNKYMKDYDKNKESLYIQYWDVNNLYGWEMSQRNQRGKTSSQFEETV